MDEKTMEGYMILFVIMIIIGIIIIVSSIYNRQKIAPWLLITLCLIGIFMAIISWVMLLCLGFFMR